MLIKFLDSSIQEDIQLNALETVGDITSFVESRYGLPSRSQKLFLNNVLLSPYDASTPLSSITTRTISDIIHVSCRLVGGKGGFGRTLRQGTIKVGQKQTSDFTAMRDLSGRRLGHIEQERQLREWNAQEHNVDRRAVQVSYERIAQGEPVRVKPCKFGLDCKYRFTTCKLMHPADPEQEELKLRKSQLKNLGSQFTHDTGGSEFADAGSNRQEHMDAVLALGLSKCGDKSVKTPVVNDEATTTTSSSSSSSSSSQASVVLLARQHDAERGPRLQRRRGR